MNLYIIRHAIAVNEGTDGYESDSERPLTDKGRKKMREIAKGLRNLGVEFDLILSSPYVRARETAEILADVFNWIIKCGLSRLRRLIEGRVGQLNRSRFRRVDLSLRSVAVVRHQLQHEIAPLFGPGHVRRR